MTSHLLYKTRCPACAENSRDRSGDNLGVYNDGHSYCYSCGYATNATASSKLRQQAKQELKEIPALQEVYNLCKAVVTSYDTNAVQNVQNQDEIEKEII